MITWILVSVLIALMAVGLRLYESPMNIYSSIASIVGHIFVKDIYPQNNTKSINEWRSRFAKSYRTGKIEYEAQLLITTLQIPSSNQTLNLRIHKPIPSPSNNNDKQRQQFPVLLWIADGGFVFGVTGQDDYKCKLIANHSNHIVVNIETRLAPEFPFPHGINDAVYSLLWVINNIDRYDGDIDHISIAGEGSGAQIALALTTLVHANQKQSLLKFANSASVLVPNFNGFRFDHLVVIHGYLDASIGLIDWQIVSRNNTRNHSNSSSNSNSNSTNSSNQSTLFWKSYQKYDNINPLLSTFQLQWFWRLYLNIHEHVITTDRTESSSLMIQERRFMSLNGIDTKSYLVSSYFLPFWVLKEYPRTSILVAENDILVDENKAFFEKLIENNVSASYFSADDSLHGFLGMNGFSIGATRTSSSDKAVRFICSELAKK